MGHALIELNRIAPFFASFPNCELRLDQLSVASGYLSLIFRQSPESFPNWLLLKAGLGIWCSQDPQLAAVQSLIKNLSRFGFSDSDILPSNSGVAIAKPHGTLVLKIACDEEPPAHYLHGYVLLSSTPLSRC